MNPLLTCAGHIDLGGPEKLGYLHWHGEADRAHKRGERQVQCRECGLWIFGFERVSTSASPKEGT